jgi:UDP-2,3-diacylglucosamine hydrolase
VQANPETTDVFISDLHLSAARPEKLRLFEALLERIAGTARRLYILGDLFEVTIGDDDDTAPQPQVMQALRRCGERGTPVLFMHGNRDFLLGAGFAQATGCTLLPDLQLIDLAQQPTLLMHGDLLCIQDVDYQKFRLRVRNPAWQRRFLSLPRWLRKLLGRYARWRSQRASRLKSAGIMDVDQTTVRQVMRDQRVALLIHGHTHRPGIHDFDLDGRTARRIVLGDWYEQDSVLLVVDSSTRLLRIDEFLRIFAQK